MSVGKDIPQAKIGDVVLVTSAGGSDWHPAFVDSASTYTKENPNTNISVIGTPYAYEGCKHENDPWWDRADAQQIARDDNVGKWKQTEQQVLLDKIIKHVPALLALVEGKPSKSNAA